MLGRVVVGMVLAVGAATPAAAATVATITAPTRTTTVTDADLMHWTRYSDGPVVAAQRAEALRFLIAAAWTEGEAVDRGVSVTDAEVRRGAEPDADLTRADERFVARLELLTARIRDQITLPAAQSVTPAQVEAYVATTPRVDPERRKARVLEARSRAYAKRALAALRRGLTWSAAARRYGTGGTLQTFDDGTGSSRDKRAIFRAKAGAPTRYGTSVIKVTRIIPARPAPLAVQRAQAWEILSSAAQQQALAAHAVALNHKWRSRTVCAAPFAAHESCGNPPLGE